MDVVGAIDLIPNGRTTAPIGHIIAVSCSSIKELAKNAEILDAEVRAGATATASVALPTREALIRWLQTTPTPTATR